MQSPEGFATVGGVGDVALKHFKSLRAFDCYKQYYIKREEAQTIFKKEMTKKSTTGFAAFVEVSMTGAVHWLVALTRFFSVSNTRRQTTKIELVSENS